jgi:hypothetical protein
LRGWPRIKPFETPPGFWKVRQEAHIALALLLELSMHGSLYLKHEESSGRPLQA